MNIIEELKREVNFVKNGSYSRHSMEREWLTDCPGQEYPGLRLVRLKQAPDSVRLKPKNRDQRSRLQGLSPAGDTPDSKNGTLLIK
jgi:hypothetical protein